MTSLPIRLSTNFINFIPSLTFTELWVVSMEHLQRVWLASRERLPFRTPGSVPILGLAYAPIVETKFLELAMSLLDFSPRIPLGTFSILLCCLLTFFMAAAFKRFTYPYQLRRLIKTPCIRFSLFLNTSASNFGLSFLGHFLGITFQRFKLLRLVKDHWRGFSAWNALMIYIVN